MQATLLVSFLSLAIVVGARGPEAEQPAAEDDADDLAEAKELYAEGKARFETADFLGAIDLWTRAYGKVPESPNTREIRNNLVYNISTAQIEAYELDNEVLHLKQAARLLERYLDEYRGLYGEGESTSKEVARVRERLEFIAAEIDAAAATEAMAPAGPRPASPSEPTDSPKRLAPLTIAGITVASVGVALSGAMIGGLVIGQRAGDRLDDHTADELSGAFDEAGRRDIIEDGVVGNRLAIGAGIASGVLVITGTVLAIVGARRSRKSARVSVGPSTGLGVLVQARF